MPKPEVFDFISWVDEGKHFFTPEFVSELESTYTSNSKRPSGNKEILSRIDAIFEKKLSAKTGWGKNEVLRAYRESVSEALMELI